MSGIHKSVSAPRRVQRTWCAALRRKWPLLSCSLAMLAGLPAHAQATPAGSLLITVNAASHLTLSFENGSGVGSPGICSITGAGSSTATLNLGTASIAGDNQSCVTFTAGSGNKSYSLGNTVYVNVTKTGNTASYTLTAKLATAAQTGVVWKADGTKLTKSAKTLTTTGTYGSNTGVALAVTVQGTVTTASIAQAIDLVATAN